MKNKPVALARRHDTAGIDWNDVAALFTDVGWTRRDPAQLAAAFATSSHVIFIHEGECLVALGRTLDDGRYYAMLVDVAVAPSHQGAGLGAEVVAYLRGCLVDYRFVTLTAAPGKEGFYRRLGWLHQSSSMIWPVSAEQRTAHAVPREGSDETVS